MDKASDEHLEQILSYIRKIEDLTERKKSVLSYAGSWENIDQELFKDLTDNLHKNRLEESDVKEE